MTWDESEHPRDEDGKFTYKNGGGKQEEKDVITEPFKLHAEINVEKK